MLTGNVKERAHDDNGEDSSAEQEAAGIHGTTNLTPTAGENTCTKRWQGCWRHGLPRIVSGRRHWTSLIPWAPTRASRGPLPRLSESLFSWLQCADL